MQNPLQMPRKRTTAAGRRCRRRQAATALCQNPVTKPTCLRMPRKVDHCSRAKMPTPAVAARSSVTSAPPGSPNAASNSGCGPADVTVPVPRRRRPTRRAGTLACGVHSSVSFVSRPSRPEGIIRWRTAATAQVMSPPRRCHQRFIDRSFVLNGSSLVDDKTVDTRRLLCGRGATICLLQTLITCCPIAIVSVDSECTRPANAYHHSSQLLEPGDANQSQPADEATFSAYWACSQITVSLEHQVTP